MRYIESMMDVLVFLYETYWRGDACPEAEHLGRKLSSAGFDDDEIAQALDWLDGLRLAIHDTQGAALATDATATATPPTLNPAQLPTDSMRIYAPSEQDHLGAECIGFIRFLETCAGLTPHLREILIDRAMAADGEPVALADFKTMVLMVYWGAGEEPDALLLGELCGDGMERVAH